MSMVWYMVEQYIQNAKSIVLSQDPCSQNVVRPIWFLKLDFCLLLYLKYHNLSLSLIYLELYYVSISNYEGYIS